MLETFRQFSSRKVYTVGKVITLNERIIAALYSLIFIFFIALSMHPSKQAAVQIVIFMLVLLPVFQTLVRGNKGRRILNARQYIGHMTARDSQIGASVLMNEVRQSNFTTDIVARGAGWETYDMTYRPIDSKQDRLHCYTIFEAALERPTPHLIFDAKRALGRQFKSYYLGEQKLSFEGDFDAYFDVYSPDHYAIDTLSFITPEVMQAFMVLKDYDAELVGDRVLLYGPLMGGEVLARFQAACQELTKQVNDNLSRYLDSFIPSKQAKRETMPYARRLLENPWRYSVFAIGGAVVIVTMLLIAFLSSLWVFVAYAGLGFVAWSYPASRFIGILRYNRHQKQLFYSDLRVIQERGRY